jgi:hypothetical protein
MTDEIFTEDHLSEGEKHPTLGPIYFAARDFMERTMSGFEEEHLKPLVDLVSKAATSAIEEKLWDHVRDSLLVDTGYNAQGFIRDAVDSTVKALLTGEKWALARYPLASRYEADKIRAAIAAHIPDEIARLRIADLEEEIKSLKENLEWARR